MLGLLRHCLVGKDESGGVRSFPARVSILRSHSWHCRLQGRDNFLSFRPTRGKCKRQDCQCRHLIHRPHPHGPTQKPVVLRKLFSFFSSLLSESLPGPCRGSTTVISIYKPNPLQNGQWSSVTIFSCSNSRITRTLTGKVQHAPDQVMGIATCLYLNETETDYFLFLVDLERAASLALKKRIEQKLEI